MLEAKNQVGHQRSFELSAGMLRQGMHFVLVAAGGIALASSIGHYFFGGSKVAAVVELLRGLGVLVFWSFAMYSRNFGLGLFGGLAVTWAGVTGLMFIEGGFTAPNLFWMTIFGPVCILAGSRKLGWTLSILTIVMFIVVWLLGVDGNLPVYSSTNNTLRAYSAILCMLVLMFVCHISTKWISELSQTLDSAESRVREKEQIQKNQFLVHMHHELRNPLTAIHAAVEMLDDSKDVRQQIFLTNAIKSTSRHVLSILNDVLEIERLSMKPEQISLEEFSPKDLAREVLNMFAVQAVDSGSYLKARLDSSVGDRWLGAPSRVRQVLVNLVSNAIKHASGADIFLSMTLKDGDLVFEVEDNGPGMSQQAMDHLYEPFASSLGERGSSGLGLRICKLIVEDHLHGSISVKSSASGTTFSVRLPFKPVESVDRSKWQYISPAGMDKTPEPEAPKTPAAIKESMRVLFIEDDRVNNEIVSMLLQTRMESVQSAFSSQEALSILGANPHGFDVVMVDQNLGDGSDDDGIELTRQIVSRYRLPVVGFTGNYSQDVRLMWDAAGVNAVLLKPASTEDIFGVLHSIAKKNQTAH